MKIKILLSIASIIFAISALAQDTLRTGNLTYIKDTQGVIQSLESTKMKGESYLEVFISTFQNKKEFKKAFREVFSKARARELAKLNYKIECQLNFNAIKKELCYVAFNVGKDKLLLTLDELSRIEEKFKSHKHIFMVKYDDKFNGFTHTYSIIDFNKLYKND